MKTGSVAQWGFARYSKHSWTWGVVMSILLIQIRKETLDLLQLLYSTVWFTCWYEVVYTMTFSCWPSAVIIPAGSGFADENNKTYKTQLVFLWLLLCWQVKQGCLWDSGNNWKHRGKIQTRWNNCSPKNGNHLNLPKVSSVSSSPRLSPTGTPGIPFSPFMACKNSGEEDIMHLWKRLRVIVL